VSRKKETGERETGGLGDTIAERAQGAEGRREEEQKVRRLEGYSLKYQKKSLKTLTSHRAHRVAKKTDSPLIID
jgi:hypothetical protein